MKLYGAHYTLLLVRFRTICILQSHSCSIKILSTHWLLTINLWSFWKKQLCWPFITVIWELICHLGAKQMEIWRENWNTSSKCTLRCTICNKATKCLDYLINKPILLQMWKAYLSSLWSPTSWAEVWLRVIWGWFCVLCLCSVSHSTTYSSTKLRVEHWVITGRSCQPFLTWAVGLGCVLHHL